MDTEYPRNLLAVSGTLIAVGNITEITMSKLFIFRELDGTSTKGLLPIGHYPDFRFPTESQDDWNCRKNLTHAHTGVKNFSSPKLSP